MIELRNVSFAYNGRAIINDLSLSIGKGDFAVLAGSTGSGKSTLIQLLTGELIPSSGEIVVGNTRVDSLSKGQLADYRRSIGVISEEIGLLDEKTIAENVALPLEIAGKDRKATIAEKVQAQLASVNLSHETDSLPKELSLGEYQRAAIARALVTEPLILIADTPTLRLDQASATEIFAILTEQNIRGMTVLITVAEPLDRTIFPPKTLFYRLDATGVQQFLPETLG